jgi:hypothetical protein
MVFVTRKLEYFELDELFNWCQENDILFTPPYFGDPYSLLLYMEDSKLIIYATLKWECSRYQQDFR